MNPLRPNFKRYLNLLLLLEAARKLQVEWIESTILEAMDTVWFQMNDYEILLYDRFSKSRLLVSPAYPVD